MSGYDGRVADERLRRLEREAVDRAGRARLLVERVRLGRLAVERLRLAAWLGDPAAAAAAGSLGPPLPPPPDELRAWLRGLGRWGVDWPVRAALAAVRHALGGAAPAPELVLALAAIEAWLACPCATHGREAVTAGERAAWPDAPAVGVALDEAVRAAVGPFIELGPARLAGPEAADHRAAIGADLLPRALA